MRMTDHMKDRTTNGQRGRRRQEHERNFQQERRATHRSEGRPEHRLIAAKAFELILEDDGQQDKSEQDPFFERLILRVLEHRLPEGRRFDEKFTRETIENLRLRARDEHDKRMLLREAHSSEVEDSGDLGDDRE